MIDKQNFIPKDILQQFQYEQMLHVLCLMLVTISLQLSVLEELHATAHKTAETSSSMQVEAEIEELNEQLATVVVTATQITAIASPEITATKSFRVITADTVAATKAAAAHLTAESAVGKPTEIAATNTSEPTSTATTTSTPSPAPLPSLTPTPTQKQRPTAIPKPTYEKPYYHSFRPEPETVILDSGLTLFSGGPSKDDFLRIDMSNRQYSSATRQQIYKRQVLFEYRDFINTGQRMGYPEFLGRTFILMENTIDDDWITFIRDFTPGIPEGYQTDGIMYGIIVGSDSERKVNWIVPARSLPDPELFEILTSQSAGKILHETPDFIAGPFEQFNQLGMHVLSPHTFRDRLQLSGTEFDRSYRAEPVPFVYDYKLSGSILHAEESLIHVLFLPEDRSVPIRIHRALLPDMWTTPKVGAEVELTIPAGAELTLWLSRLPAKFGALTFRDIVLEPSSEE